MFSDSRHTFRLLLRLVGMYWLFRDERMVDLTYSNTPSGYSETHALLKFFFFYASVFCFSERKMAESSKKAAARPKPLSILRSVEEKYTAAMKKLQFGES